MANVICALVSGLPKCDSASTAANVDILPEFVLWPASELPPEVEADDEDDEDADEDDEVVVAEEVLPALSLAPDEEPVVPFCARLALSSALCLAVFASWSIVLAMTAFRSDVLK